MTEPIIKSNDDFKKELPPDVYHVTREKGTERPFSGKYYKSGSKGMFQCFVCGNQLFSSDAQYESRMEGLSGWPSFEEALPGAVQFEHDPSMGMDRTEVLCAQCGSHLGHIFDGDKDAKTGKHYCINSCALKLDEKQSNMIYHKNDKNVIYCKNRNIVIYGSKNT